jgi:hypothetical protein
MNQTHRPWPPADRQTVPRRHSHAARRARGDGAVLLVAASCLLLLLAAAQGYVSFRAQYAFVDHAKRTHLPSILEALGLDTGAVIFALLALSLAQRGSRASVERVLNVACALGSLTMNLLAADLTSPRSITVWVMPSALYALASDRLIAVVRRWALASDPASRPAQEGSAWRGLGGLAFWVLRLIFDTPGTLAGFRRWILVAAPVAPGIRADIERKIRKPKQNAKRQLAGPSPANQPHAQTDQPTPNGLARVDLAPGETKRDALIRLYELCGQKRDPRYGDRAKTAALAGELADRIGYHPGTARRELSKYLTRQQQPSPVPHHGPRPATRPRIHRPADLSKNPVPAHISHSATESNPDAEAVA